MKPLPLDGCRHDVLGHYLKGIGLLRAVSTCADAAHRDTEAEGWWDMDQARFVLRSPMYSTIEQVVRFFREHYRPTAVMAAWNKDIGLTASIAKSFGVSPELEIASGYAARLVPAEEKKKSEDPSKITAAQSYAAYRDDSRHDLSEMLDAISASRYTRGGDNPVFLAKGIAGRAHLFRSYWEYLRIFAKHRESKNPDPFTLLLQASLTATALPKPTKGKGTPFFPDAIKGYNAGAGWVQESYPFNAFDYILAVEGALALRGSVGRALSAGATRYPAFPFVFDSGEDLVDDSNGVKGTASSLWLPLWDRSTTFAELASYIGDAQSRLPGKDARFSAEFVRALNAQGVDAGFSGWQEFRFKMRGSRVPWITTGSYVDSLERRSAAHPQTRSVTLLNLALAPLDESRFLDQFDIQWKGNKADSRSPHPVRAEITAAMETAALEPTAHNCLQLLERIFAACRRMCLSESFRQRLHGKRASFFAPLPTNEWNRLLASLEHQPEFRIARALASITGLQVQGDGSYSDTQPMLGSLLPLKSGHSGWYLPEEKRERKQCVWTGHDIAPDLAAVLRRRYLDSSNEDVPALRAVHGARLTDVLAFLRGALDDGLIARWTEAMSLIGWRFEEQSCDEVKFETEEEAHIPAEYAALRTLLEIECEWQGSKRQLWKKRRSQQPFALLCEHSTTSLPFAMSEAFRWLSVWGVPNAWSAASRAEKPRIAGRYVVRLADSASLSLAYDQRLALRLAAAVCIPLNWRGAGHLYRAVTLPPGID